MTETCEICGDTFESERGLHVHQSQVHPDSEKTCPVCGEEFDSERGMHIHRTQVHEKEEDDESEDDETDDDTVDSETDTEKISEKELVQIVGGDIKYLKDFLEKERSIETLKRLLEDEKLAQDRSEAKKLLQEAINKKEFGKDFDRALEELDQMKTVLSEMREKELGEREFNGEELKDIEPMTAVNLMEGDFSDMKEFLEDENPSIDQIEDLIEAESRGKERDRVIELLKSTKHQKRLFLDLRDAQKSINDVKGDLNDIIEESAYVHPKSLKDYGPHEKVEKEESEKSKLRRKLSNYGYNDEELQNLERDELETLLEVIDQKKEIIEDLAVNFDDKELSDVDLENLKALREEREEREDLISELKKAGMDEEKLRDSSTPDLRKLSENMDDGEYRKDPQDNSETGEEEDELDEEEIEKEAEEDLEMLMGAVKSAEEETDEEDKDIEAVEHFKEYKKNIKEIFSSSSSKEMEEQIRDRKVIDLLEEYRELEMAEKAIKTAHVMKGYLEFKMNIPQELTYHELARELEEEEGEEMEILEEFFEKMAEDQYLEKISIENMDQVIEAAEQTAKDMG